MKYLKIGLYLFLVFVIFEILFRLFNPFGIGYFNQAFKYLRSCRSTHLGYYLNHNEESNGQGLRWYEIKDTDKKRILLIGDSVVYGLGIKFNETFAYRLQQISNYDIINAGVGGWNTQNEYLWLKHEGISFDPDIVVLFITSNDHDNVYAGKIPKYTRFQRMIYRSYVLSTMFYIKRGLFSLILGRSTIKEIGEDSYKIAEESLQGIIDFVGDRLIVCMYGTTQTVQQTKVMRFYLDILKENKIPCFFLPDKIYENRISRIDGHLNAKGHRMISQVLYAVLKQYENFVDH